MPTIVNINSITSGTPPYHIWICDTCYGTCIYQATTSIIPYSFTLPTIYETYASFVIKIIDDNGCVYCYDADIYKQFQNSDLFEFMDGLPYNFQ